MSVPIRRAVRLEEPVPSERTPPSQPRPEAARVDRVGRVRVPLTLTHRPWATLYRGPAGDEIWTLRLSDGGRPKVVCVTTERLLRYAVVSGLAQLWRDIERLRGSAAPADARR